MNRTRRTPLGELFGGDCPALPLDLLRIFVALLAGIYFLNLFQEAADFSGPDGLLDHALVQEIFPFTRLGLFHPGVSLGVLRVVYAFAAAASLAVLAGWRVKFFAACQFLAAVSAFRWNFLTAYVEDAIMHLMLLWLLLLPVGRTLVFAEAWRDPRVAWRRWLAVRVPGTAVGAFLCNLALIYLVAGLWKWTSPMWRDGTALFVVLKLPIAHAPDFWQPAHLTVLKFFNWAALVAEPLLSLALLLRRGHPLKWLLLAALAGFHLGIVVTLKIPFANLACLAASVVTFREEIMAWLAPHISPPPDRRLEPCGFAGRCAVGFVIVLALAMLRFVPAATEVKPQDYNAEKLSIDPRGGGGLAAVHEKLYYALWFAGVAQEYQLFNWIDTRNHHVRYEVTEFADGGVRPIDPVEIFPRTNHSILLQCYLHDLNWFAVPAAHNAALKRSLALRFAQRYCRTHTPRGTVIVTASIERIMATRPWPVEHPPHVLFSFSFRDGAVILHDVPGDSPVRPTQVARLSSATAP
jgi:hypothetical protein